MDIKFKWTRFRFVLRDAKLISSVEIQEQDSDGDWVQREAHPFTFGDDGDKKRGDEFEAIKKELRHHLGARCLTAMAFTEDDGDCIFLGVPEDKNGFTSPRESKLNSLAFTLLEADTELQKTVRHGCIGHIEAMDLSSEMTYLQLYATPETFDEIEKLVDYSNGLIEIECNLKCHRWIDPLGHQSIYIDPEQRTLAEWSRFSVSKRIANQPDANEYVVEEGLEDTNPAEKLLHQKLNAINVNILSVRAAAWVTAFVAVVAAAKLFL